MNKKLPRCKYNENYACLSENPTKIDCLFCILERLDSSIREFLALISPNTQVPLCVANRVYYLALKMFDIRNELMDWTEQYYPDKLQKAEMKFIDKIFELMGKQEKSYIS